MQAYRDALTGNDTTFVLSPDSEFFRFFGGIKPDESGASSPKP
jgi:membrane protease subunit HflC